MTTGHTWIGYIQQYDNFGFVQMYGIPAAHDKYKTEWGTLLQDSLTV